MDCIFFHEIIAHSGAFLLLMNWYCDCTKTIFIVEKEKDYKRSFKYIKL